PFVNHRRVLCLELVESADARADEHATVVGGKLGEIYAGVLDGGLGGNQSELRKSIQVPRLLDAETSHGVPTANLSTKVNLELGRVKEGQRSHPAPAGAERVPVRVQALPYRCDHTHAGDDDAARLSHGPLNDHRGNA